MANIEGSALRKRTAPCQCRAGRRAEGFASCQPGSHLQKRIDRWEDRNKYVVRRMRRLTRIEEQKAMGLHGNTAGVDSGYAGERERKGTLRLCIVRWMIGLGICCFVQIESREKPFFLLPFLSRSSVKDHLILHLSCGGRLK